MFSPGMSKVDDENQLNQDEEEGSTQAEVHPWNKKFKFCQTKKANFVLMMKQFFCWVEFQMSNL